MGEMLASLKPAILLQAVVACTMKGLQNVTFCRKL